MATFRSQRMYVAPALLAVGKGVMTALNVGGTAMAAKDMISGDNEDNKPSYNPQNTALVNNTNQIHPKQFSMATIGKGAMDIAKGLGKGVWKFSKDNKRSLAGTVAFGTAMTAGMNKLSHPSDPNKENKPTSNSKIAAMAGTAGTGTTGYMLAKNHFNNKSTSKKISDLTKKGEGLVKEGFTNNRYTKEAGQITKELATKNANKFKKAGKWGLIAAGVTGTGMMAKNSLDKVKKTNPDQKSYANVALLNQLRKSGGKGFKMAGQLTKNAFNSAKSGDLSRAGKELGGALKMAGSKVVDSGVGFMSFGKANDAYKTMTTSLKNQGGAAKSLGKFLGKHDTIGKAAGGLGIAGTVYGAADRVGGKIGDKIVKPTEKNN